MTVQIQVGHKISGAASGSTSVPPMTTTIDMSHMHHESTGVVAPALPDSPSCGTTPPSSGVATESSSSCPYLSAHAGTSPSGHKKALDVFPLYQKDFDAGGIFITKPGTYVLQENIVCHKFFERQLTEQGTINPLFTGNANSARANIGIAICCSDVTIDGNGFSLQQSAQSATENRVFTAIECSGINLTSLSGQARQRTCPALMDPLDQGGSRYYGNNNATFGGGGPQEVNPEDLHEFYDDVDNLARDELLAKYKDLVGDFADVGNENITIKNMTFGRSSHFSIHGTDNRGLFVHDCKFFEFEVAAIWLNNPITPRLERLDIVGMQQFPQTLSQLWAFRTQGTGVKGVVNASYWGIILNQNFGGVGVVFPQPSGGTLPEFESGKSFAKQLEGNKVHDTFTDGGVNKQNIGPRNAILRDINIAQLQSQMITGVCLGRQTAFKGTDSPFDGDVPILFSNEAGVLVGGGGHGGYTAKDKTIRLASNDFEAFYHNPVSYRWARAQRFALSAATGASEYATFVQSSAEYSKVDGVDLAEDHGPEWADLSALRVNVDQRCQALGLDVEDVKAKLDAHLVLYDPSVPVQNKLRLADRALQWTKSAGGAVQEGKPKHNPYHQGLVQYRGRDTDAESGAFTENTQDYDKFLFVYTNVYTPEGQPLEAPYPADQVRCHSDKAVGGQAWYRQDGAGQEDELNPVYRATVVVPVVNDMVVNHCGPRTGEPWWVSRNFNHQNASEMPIDFGGHEMNGVVPIHCDRMWGCLFERVNIVNARNLKDPRYREHVQDYHEMPSYPLKLGFSASVWGIMMNDSGGNIVRHCNTLNMLARTGSSFAMHNAFGSRGNVWEDCKALSCAGGAMWGFVADKGATGNIFRRCEAQNIVGSAAAAGFVMRGNHNLLEQCKALDTQLVLDPALEDAATGVPPEIRPDQRVAAGFLLDVGGTDEPERLFARIPGYNVFRDCESLKSTVSHVYQLDRNASILYQLAGSEEQKARTESFLKGGLSTLQLDANQKTYVPVDTLKPFEDIQGTLYQAAGFLAHDSNVGNTLLGCFVDGADASEPSGFQEFTVPVQDDAL